MGCLDPACPPGVGDRHVDLPLSLASTRSGRAREADPGDRRDPGALRLSACACSVASGGLAGECQAVYRLYREQGLQLRNKVPKRRVKAKLREDRQLALRPNDVWAMDFLHDQLATGRKIRVDQGSEFVSRDLDLWAYARGVTLDFSRPGKPTDNAVAEAFNSRIRAECLNAHWFLTLADAREKLEAWRRYYNEERPHGRSATSCRFRCRIPVTQPVRHRDERPETPASGAPMNGRGPIVQRGKVMLAMCALGV